MTDAAPATLVWIAPEPASADESRTLAAWARARGVRLVEPTTEEVRALDDPARDAARAGARALAAEVDELLERAQDALAAHETEAVERALEAAETRLRAHAELPQAAWLMAEVERVWSARWRSVPPLDAEAADRAWERAEALDGGRVVGIGEQSSATRALAASVELRVPAGDRIQFDGRAVENGTSAITTAAGPHAVVVLAEAVPVWAGWLDVAAGTTRLAIDAPAVAPCSAADVTRPPERVTCPRWVAASPAAGAGAGGVRVAVCEAGRCGAWVDWREAPAWATQPGGQGAPHDAAHGAGGEKARLPAWALWTTAGIVAAGIGAGIAIVASGVLQTAPTETRFVNGGLKTQ